MLALAPLAAMAAIQQRASVGYLVIAMFFLMAAGICKHPYRMGIPVLLAVAAVVIMAPIWTDIVQTLTHKNALVGFNMRGREASAVMDVIDEVRAGERLSCRLQWAARLLILRIV